MPHRDPSFTILVFGLMLILMFLVPLSYNLIGAKKMNKINNSNLLLDKRLMLICIVYALVFGLVYDYGWDWMAYKNYFLNQETNSNQEIGYRLLNSWLLSSGFSYFSIFVIMKFVWIIGTCYLFKENRKLLIFVLPMTYIGFVRDALFVSRQFMSMGLLIMAYACYYHNKNIRALLFAVIAVVIHKITIAWAIIFIFFKYIKSLNINIIIPLFLAIFFATSIFSQYITQAADTASLVINGIGIDAGYDSQRIFMERFEREDISILQFVGKLLIGGGYVFSYYYLIRKKLVTNEYFINLMSLGIIGFLTTMVLGTNEILNRVGMYVSYFYYVGWGIILYYATMVRNKINNIVRIAIVLTCVYLVYGFFKGVTGSAEKDKRLNIEYKL